MKNLNSIDKDELKYFFEVDQYDNDKDAVRMALLHLLNNGLQKQHWY